MKHPSREDWIEFLHEEASPALADTLRQHLNECPECASNLANWARVVRALPSWRVPDPKKHPEIASKQIARPDFTPDSWKWRALAAAAAVAAFLAGTTVSNRSGDLQALSRDVAALKAAAPLHRPEDETAKARMAADVAGLKAKVALLDRLYAQATNETSKALIAAETVNRASQQALADLAEAERAERAREGLRLANMIRDAEYRQQTRLALLRQDLETVAALADEQFQSTRQNLIRISSVSRNDHTQH